MALIKCKECGGEVSSKAKACPNCGAKPPKKTSFVTWGILAVIVLTVYGSWQEQSRLTPAQKEARAEQRAAERASEERRSSKVKAQKTSNTYSSEHERVKKIFQSDAEKVAKDAVWTAPNIFKVGVLDNKSPRDGYASYVCEVLYAHGFKGKGVWVQVIDIVKLTRNGDWVRLGEARCQ